MTSITPATVFVVSGGARGITARCVIEMAQHFRCKFILLGRTPRSELPAWAQGVEDEAQLKKQAIADFQARGEKPTPALIGRAVSGVLAQREIQHTLEAVRATGGEAVYASADITDAVSLRAALDGASHLGPVSGILHGAGNLADKLIENKTEADFEKVYTTKVQGLENLLAIVPAERLQFLVLFSSVAGFYGNIGQADYAIANEILNKTAHQIKQRHPGCHVVSINWGPWDGGMVTPQLREYFDKLNIRVIPADVGARMLVEELRGGAQDAPAQIVVGSAIRPQPSAPPAELKTYRLHRSLHLMQNRFLGDHVVNGQAVLPMVSAMSWIANACEQIHRGYRYVSFSDYRVLKGIVFDDTLADEYVLELKETAKSADEIRLDALVRSQSSNDKPRFHYRTEIVLKPQVPEAPTLDLSTAPSAAEPIPGERLYRDGTLFHGYSFQGVQEVLRIDETGLMMRCVLPVVDLDYQGQFPIQSFNYFMVDIGLQSIGIWSRHVYDMGSLPLRAAHGEQYSDGVPGGEFYVTMQVRAHNKTNVTANIILHDENGLVYMAIDDLEVTMSQRLNEMFLNNRLPEFN